MFKKEIKEQPEVARRVLENQSANIQAIADELRKQDIRYVFLTGRGTSDNAGLYAKYMLGIENGIPIALAAPSIFSIYRKTIDLDKALVLGISQSGQSPDIVSVLHEAQLQGVPTLAITNDTDSPLAKAGDFVIDIMAGQEKAVAASKTYTSELLSMAMLSLAWGEDEKKQRQLNLLPGYMEQVLMLEAQIEQAAADYADMRHCTILGRGYNYATVYEWALKLKELAYVLAEPYSSADFLHGPIALVDESFPVMSVLVKGGVYQDMLQLLENLKNNKRADLLVISNGQEALEIADRRIELPEDMPEWMSPMVSIIPAQLFCYFVTQAKGYDPDMPRGLKKVTETH